MFFRELIIGILTVLIGMVFCFSGYRLQSVARLRHRQADATGNVVPRYVLYAVQSPHGGLYPRIAPPALTSRPDIRLRSDCENGDRRKVWSTVDTEHSSESSTTWKWN